MMTLTHQKKAGARGSIPLAVVAMVALAALLLFGTMYFLRAWPEPSLAAEQDLVRRASELIRTLKRRVEYEKETLSKVGAGGTNVVSGLMQASPPDGEPSEVAPLSGLRLTGILWDPARPLAVFAGSVVGVGERVGGRRVVDIQRESVALEDRRGNRQVLQLYK